MNTEPAGDRKTLPDKLPKVSAFSTGDREGIFAKFIQFKDIGKGHGHLPLSLLIDAGGLSYSLQDDHDLLAVLLGQTGGLFSSQPLV